MLEKKTPAAIIEESQEHGEGCRKPKMHGQALSPRKARLHAAFCISLCN